MHSFNWSMLCSQRWALLAPERQNKSAHMCNHTPLWQEGEGAQKASFLSHTHILQAFMHCSHTMKRWDSVVRWPLHCESFGLSLIQGFNSSVLIVSLSSYRNQSCTCPADVRWPTMRLYRLVRARQGLTCYASRTTCLKALVISEDLSVPKY